MLVGIATPTSKWDPNVHNNFLYDSNIFTIPTVTSTNEYTGS